MDEEVKRLQSELLLLRTKLGEAEARAAYAAFMAETTFSIATLNMPRENVTGFLKGFLKGFKKTPAQFPGDAAIAARVAGLFADFAARNGVRDDGG